MIKRSFQHTAFFLWPVDSSSSEDVHVHSRALYRNLNLHPTTTLFPKVSRGPIVRDLHSKHRTFRSYRGRGWNKKKWTKFKANQFAVLHVRGRNGWFTHESFMLSSLLGLWRPFLCSRVFCSIYPLHFWLHKGMFRSGLESKNYHGSSRSKGTGRHFGSVQIVGHILAFVLPPICTLRQWRDFERDKLVGEGRYGRTF